MMAVCLNGKREDTNKMKESSNILLFWVLEIQTGEISLTNYMGITPRITHRIIDIVFETDQKVNSVKRKIIENT